MAAPALPSRIEVESPTSRQLLGTQVQVTRIAPLPAGEQGGAPPGTGPEPADREERRTKVAVLVCHGMGQQVPFEHIDLVTAAIRRGAKLDDAVKARVKFVTLGDQRLPRAEIDLDTVGVEREVHVYEAYWAPLTEGKVSALDVTRFLFDAGFRGIEYALRGSFDRLMMGRWHTFPLGAGTFFRLLAAFAVVCSALLLYAALGLVAGVLAGEFLFGGGISPVWIDVLVPRLLADLFRSPLLLSVLLPPALAVVWVWRVLRGRRQSGNGRRGTRPGGDAGDRVWRRPLLRTWVSAGLALLAGLWTVYAALAVLTDLPRAFFSQSAALHGFKRLLVLNAPEVVGLLPGGEGQASPAELTFQLYFLVSAVLACAWIRSFYIQCLGDVAVYLSSHKLNEFDELRTQIRKIGRDVGCAIYRALDRECTGHEYDGIVVVGHSLGSVVAYDTLNAVLNLEMTLDEHPCAKDPALRAEDRTLRFITFGSPLDKSAFIFRTQKERSEVREGLVAAVQPLIGSKGGKRKIRWVNLHSRMDPISGSIEYYDPPFPGPKPENPPPHVVHDKHDPEANVFGHAHTAYWTGSLFAAELFEAVKEQPRGAVTAHPPA